MAAVKVTPFRFSEEELALLGLIQGHTGIRSRTEALRKVLRYYVENEGIEAGNRDEGDKSKVAGKAKSKP